MKRALLSSRDAEDNKKFLKLNFMFSFIEVLSLAIIFWIIYVAFQGLATLIKLGRNRLTWHVVIYLVIISERAQESSDDAS